MIKARCYLTKRSLLQPTKVLAECIERLTNSYLGFDPFYPYKV